MQTLHVQTFLNEDFHLPLFQHLSPREWPQFFSLQCPFDRLSHGFQLFHQLAEFC